MRIQIIGGGTFGLSTAYYLSKSGYDDITVIDREEVPSSVSAGHDLNKIIRPEYEDDFYTNLALEAIKVWESKEFSPYFHKVGYINCNSPQAPQKSVDITGLFYKTLCDNPNFPRGEVSLLESEEDFRKAAPQLKDTDFKGWKGYFNKHAGYALAYKAMEFVTKECKKNGVRFITDTVESIVYDKDKCVGVATQSGIYESDLTIIALGAYVTLVVPEISQYVTAQAWSVGHVQLDEQEATRLKGMPVLNCRDIGFCFEPDAETRILKLCNSSAGWVNVESDISVPTVTNDGVCLQDKQALDTQVHTFFPKLQKKVSQRKICWCCDRPNSDYVIDYHPRYSNLLFATADSGHAFKMLPIFGKWVVQKLQNTLPPEHLRRWRWFHEGPNDPHTPSWRLGAVQNLHRQPRF